MINYFELIGMGFCAGFGFFGGLVTLCYVGDLLSFWWEDRKYKGRF